jgi:predicted Zn-dependent protease with MMP-like domain
VALKRRGRQAQRQPGRRADLRPLPESRHQPFESLVEQALDGLPEGVQKLLENVAIVIEDEPSAEQLRESGLGPHDSLYGLYEGVSPVTYGADLVPFPNKITLFRLPLEEDFADPDELAREVQKTVIHEIGHHAGIDEQRLHNLGF